MMIGEDCEEEAEDENKDKYEGDCVVDGKDESEGQEK